ncbi:Gfo/Idh/MocA family protein [Bosea sp. LjRoot237]|uniref:Gfo/Idh/MocA family protein n=1 Tax=Bosea sp. LjRoot237 TaxID=3342292 RepID=UPI003ECDB14F
MSQFSVAIVGAGAIGRLHADVIQASGFAGLAGIADPTEAGRRFCEERGIAWFADHAALLEKTGPEALIVATPNNTHLPIALDALAAGVTALVEKPVASTVEEGLALAEASARAGVPVLVGHHRRHNPIIARARELVALGALGRLTNASVLYTFFKPDGYFEMAWRREPGGGPILINLIHEIDLIRFVCGEIESVQAATSNAVRGFGVEDTAAVVLRLVNGALVTISLSDTAVTPWSWDLASGELPGYPAQPAPVNSHYISGTEGSLTLPGLDLWRYGGERSWFNPISRDSLAVVRASPYVEQLRHLCEVARGEATPLIDAADATRTLRATLAVSEAAQTGRRVTLVSG